MNQILKTWGNMIAHPSPTKFNDELSKDYATQKTAIAWFTVGVLVASIVNGLSSFIRESIFASYVGYREAMVVFFLQSLQDQDKASLIIFVGSPLFGGIFSFLSFFVGGSVILLLGNTFSLWLARTLGGTGSSAKQLFALASFMPALLIIANIFNVIRQIGVCIVSPVLWLYALVLSIFAIKSIHGLSTTKSVITVIIPFMVLTLVAVILNPQF